DLDLSFLRQRHMCICDRSLGVFMAEIAGLEKGITAAFAINGTLSPADDNLGIPEVIYKKTADSLTPSSFIKFRRRMAGNSETFRKFHDLEISSEKLSELKSQLFSILDFQQSENLSPLPWKKAFISLDDAIFPSGNQIAFWQKKGLVLERNIITSPGAHYIEIEDIIGTCIPNTEKIALNFSNASETYDNEAKAQKIMAEKLVDFIGESVYGNIDKILEIGCGTGLLTNDIISRFNPDRLDLLDISDVCPDTRGISSTFYKADAESWIAGCKDRYDAILSSSTVQWFVNLPLFLKNASNVLKRGGFLAFSTFLTGNLHELDSLRPSPIHYHSQSEIETMLKKVFDEVRTESMEIKLSFDSPGALMKHLKKTGVTGSAPNRKLSMSQIRNLKTLTFKCGFFMARDVN
ncbi:MAG: DUF452 family protein, partial [Muribaculaceae bacterium]|nr:DUF452 family protein [Muribaculaceae bacterium]